MAKGFLSDGVDFDDLFDPDVVGDGPSATWLTSDGVALRYARLQYGQKRADVGFYDNGVDVSNLWAAKGTAVYAKISNQNMEDTTGDGSVPRCRYFLNANGQAQKTQRISGSLTTVNIPGEWLTSGSTSGFEARLTVLSGTAPNEGDAINTWHSLSANRFWGLARATLGTSAGSYIVEIRRSDSGVVVASAAINMTSIRDAS